MSTLNFIDLFSGCGGLSLGLSLAGLQGVFAVERDPMAFSTFSANFLNRDDAPVERFLWPQWLEKRAWAIDDLLAAHEDELKQLRGKIQMLAGGPPCQGFSLAGRREESDPRNQMFKKYVRMVDLVRPQAIVLENVPGMKMVHGETTLDAVLNDRVANSFYDKLRQSLSSLGYDVEGKILNACHFGVPQRRSRLIVLGLRRDISQHLEGGISRAFELLESARIGQLQQLGITGQVSAQAAISDLEIMGKELKACDDPFSPPGFHELDYQQPKTPFQELMHAGSAFIEMDSMRLARHRDEVRERFSRILADCPRGVCINKEHRERYGLKKHRIMPMSASEPAPTITTLPDDILHYSEPRILTVRECARLQSFPDWFVFRGKYTTGGQMRTKECPRYTQVGNAVPPYMARAIGIAIALVLEEANSNALIYQEENKKMRPEAIAL